MRVLLILFFSATCFCSINFSHAQTAKVGEFAPNWVLDDTDGLPISLYQQADAGTTTVMVFWASWCTNCQSLLPTLRELQAKRNEHKFEIYLMNIWEDRSTEALKASANNLKVLMNADNLARRFDIGTTPGIVIVGPDRRIIYKRASGSSMEEVAIDLNQLLLKQIPTPEK